MSIKLAQTKTILNVFLLASIRIQGRCLTLDDLSVLNSSRRALVDRSSQLQQLKLEVVFVGSKNKTKRCHRANYQQTKRESLKQLVLT